MLFTWQNIFNDFNATKSVYDAICSEKSKWFSFSSLPISPRLFFVCPNSPQNLWAIWILPRSSGKIPRKVFSSFLIFFLLLFLKLFRDMVCLRHHIINKKRISQTVCIILLCPIFESLWLDEKIKYDIVIMCIKVINHII